MEISEAQYERIKDALPVQRGNVSLSNLQVLNAVLYVAEHGCKWRGLPKRFGRWHTVYMRMSRWSKSGVLDRVFEKLQVEQIVRIKLEAVSLDSTSIKGLWCKLPDWARWWEVRWASCSYAASTAFQIAGAV